MIALTDFARKYDVNPSTMLSFIKRHPEFGEKKGKSYWVDERKLLAAKDAQEKIWHFTTAIYYPLVDIYGTEAALAERLSLVSPYSKESWKTFFQQELFLLQSEDITYIQIGEKRKWFAILGTRLLDIFYGDDPKCFDPDEPVQLYAYS